MGSITELVRLGYIGARGCVIPEGGNWLPVENPATGNVIGEAYEMSAAELDELVSSGPGGLRLSLESACP